MIAIATIIIQIVIQAQAMVQVLFQSISHYPIGTPNNVLANVYDKNAPCTKSSLLVSANAFVTLNSFAPRILHYPLGTPLSANVNVTKRLVPCTKPGQPVSANAFVTLTLVAP